MRRENRSPEVRLPLRRSQRTPAGSPQAREIDLHRCRNPALHPHQIATLTKYSRHFCGPQKSPLQAGGVCEARIASKFRTYTSILKEGCFVVARRRHHTGPVRQERGGPDRIKVPIEHGDLGPGFGVPQPCRFVVRRRHQTCPIRRSAPAASAHQRGCPVPGRDLGRGHPNRWPPASRASRPPQHCLRSND
jgi:hypothetical protein